MKGLFYNNITFFLKSISVRVAKTKSVCEDRYESLVSKKQLEGLSLLEISPLSA